MVDMYDPIKVNRDYNEARKRIFNSYLSDKDIQKRLDDLYSEAKEKIDARINEAYLRFANRENISLSDVKKLADKMDVEKFKDRARLAVQRKDFAPRTNQWLKVYNLKARVNRLELIKAEIDLELNQLYNGVHEFMHGYLIEEGFRELERGTATVGNVGFATEINMEKIVNMDFLGKNFSERIWGKNGHYDNHQKEIFKSLSNIFTHMDGYNKEVKRLSNLFEIINNNVMTLIRTEVSRVTSQVDYESLTQNEFTHYMYVTEPHHCEICNKLDRKVFRIEDWEMGVTAKPMHPNCRCDFIGIVKVDGSKFNYKVANKEKVIKSIRNVSKK